MPDLKITREQFEENYARLSGITIEWLREHGREARPCDCDYEGCEGWQMAYIAEARYAAEHGFATPAELRLLKFDASPDTGTALELRAKYE